MQGQRSLVWINAQYQPETAHGRQSAKPGDLRVAPVWCER